MLLDEHEKVCEIATSLHLDLDDVAGGLVHSVGEGEGVCLAIFLLLSKAAVWSGVCRRTSLRRNQRGVNLPLALGQECL
jgi:hypothetical protein